MQYRDLSNTGMKISAVGLGCWPIAGITSPGVDDANSVATIQACFDLGINHLDTAHAYGRRGESEVRIGKALGPRRGEMLIATKVGLHWDAGGNLLRDASPATLRRHVEESLRRLGTDRIDLLYLHAPDPNVPVAESAGALRQLMDEGKARSIGASNLSVAELARFAAECPLAACQPLYNMLQREIEADVLPWCRQHGVAVLVYEPLAKGLLTGKFRAGHVFAESDWRRTSPLFSGPPWQKSLELVEQLRPLAKAAGCSVAQLATAWTIAQPGITAAICGAKRPEQIAETAASSGARIADEIQTRITALLANRGP